MLLDNETPKRRESAFSQGTSKLEERPDAVVTLCPYRHGATVITLFYSGLTEHEGETRREKQYNDKVDEVRVESHEPAVNGI